MSESESVSHLTAKEWRDATEWRRYTEVFTVKWTGPLPVTAGREDMQLPKLCVVSLIPHDEPCPKTK